MCSCVVYRVVRPAVLAFIFVSTVHLVSHYNDHSRRLLLACRVKKIRFLGRVNQRISAAYRKIQACDATPVDFCSSVALWYWLLDGSQKVYKQ